MKELIKEQYLTSDFNFGIELECFFPNKKHKEIYSLFTDNEWTYSNDSSIVSPITLTNAFETKEFKSKVYQLTPSNLNTLKKILNSAFDLGVRTNNSCGLHIHFSINLDKDNDKNILLNKVLRIFALHNIITNPELSDLIIGFKFDGLLQKTWTNNRYANLNVTKKVAQEIEKVIDSKEYNNLFTIHDKYAVLNLHHRYCTLEWRGPRGLFNSKGNAKGNINLLVERIITMSKIISKSLSNPEIHGVKPYDVLSQSRAEAINIKDNFNPGAIIQGLKDNSNNEFASWVDDATKSWDKKKKGLSLTLNNPNHNALKNAVFSGSTWNYSGDIEIYCNNSIITDSFFSDYFGWFINVFVDKIKGTTYQNLDNMGVFATVVEEVILYKIPWGFMFFKQMNNCTISFGTIKLAPIDYKTIHVNNTVFNKINLLLSKRVDTKVDGTDSTPKEFDAYFYDCKMENTDITHSESKSISFDGGRIKNMKYKVPGNKLYFGSNIQITKAWFHNTTSKTKMTIDNAKMEEVTIINFDVSIISHECDLNMMKFKKCDVWIDLPRIKKLQYCTFDSNCMVYVRTYEKINKLKYATLYAKIRLLLGADCKFKIIEE